MQPSENLTGFFQYVNINALHNTGDRVKVIGLSTLIHAWKNPGIKSTVKPTTLSNII